MLFSRLKVSILILLGILLLWTQAYLGNSLSWRPESNPPVFYCFRNDSLSAMRKDASVAVFTNAPLVVLCRSSSCLSRVRRCSPGEEPSGLYRRRVAPTLTMALLTLPLWSFVVHFALRRDHKEAEEAEDRMVLEEVEEDVSMWRLYFMPDTVLFEEDTKESRT